MADRISPGRMSTIDFMLAHPGRFTKADLRDVAAELRAEIDLLNEALQRTLPHNANCEGIPSCPSSTTAATSAPAAPGSMASR